MGIRLTCFERRVLDVVLAGVVVDELVDDVRAVAVGVVDLHEGSHFCGSASSGKIASTGHSGSQAPQSATNLGPGDEINACAPPISPPTSPPRPGDLFFDTLYERETPARRVP
jgi:hypothetical protein